MQEAKEHYELLKEDYQKQVEKLTKLVDGAVDPVDFMKASGTSARVTNNISTVYTKFNGKGCSISMYTCITILVVLILRGHNGLCFITII